METLVRNLLVVLKWSGISLLALVASILVAAVVLPALTRGYTDRWGATEAEVNETLPGDEYVEDPQQSATRAITIDAPAYLVNQLVRQQGYERAGWHGWDWFYDATGSGDFVDGHFSRRVVPELQDIEIGDMIHINKMVGYKVAIDDRPQTFVLYSGADAGGNQLDPADSAKATKASTSWAWVARPLSPSRTRLILRIQGDMRGQGALAAWLFDNPLDLGGALFANKTLHGIKETAEALAAGEGSL